MSHYSELLNEEQTDDSKKKLLNLINKMNQEDLTVMLRIANNIKTYKEFEKFINLILKK